MPPSLAAILVEKLKKVPDKVTDAATEAATSAANTAKKTADTKVRDFFFPGGGTECTPQREAKVKE